MYNLKGMPHRASLTPSAVTIFSNTKKHFSRGYQIKLPTLKSTSKAKGLHFLKKDGSSLRDINHSVLSPEHDYSKAYLTVSHKSKAEGQQFFPTDQRSNSEIYVSSNFKDNWNHFKLKNEMT